MAATSSQDTRNGSFQFGGAVSPLRPVATTLLSSALLPDGEGYARKDVLLKDGLISRIAEAGSLDCESLGCDEVIDAAMKMLLPGFVNAHTHSVEHWARGLIKPLPLELWVQQLIRHEPRGEEGWHGKESFVQTPSEAVGLSAMHCGVEALLSGCTAVLDHLFIRNLDDLGAAVAAYKSVGLRAFIAPMLDDDAEKYTNYIPLACDAEQRNAAAGGCSCGAMGSGGRFRTTLGNSDSAKAAAALALWEAAVQAYHDPEGGVEIVIGPVTAYSASTDLLRGATALRQKHGLCGHTHLLETRAQALLARQALPSGSAVRHLDECGFLALRGTSCAHTVWLDDDEIELMARTGAVSVHNPLSNLRLGSGVMPVQAFLERGARVAMGCDGACSSDGQDILEAIKLATTLPCITSSEYRQWPAPRQALLTLAAKNGYAAIGMEDRGGAIAEGHVADLSLWDLTSLSLLPRTDPIALLVLGSRTQAPGAGSALHSSWVRGVKVVSEGAPCGVDLHALRAELIRQQPEYREQGRTDPMCDPLTRQSEVEYRAAMGLNPLAQQAPTPTEMGVFRQGRVTYDATIP